MAQVKNILLLSSLSLKLQKQIRAELCIASSMYNYSNLPVLDSKVLKALVKDYLFTSNLNLTTDDHIAIARGQYAGIFVKSSPGKRYEVLLVRSGHLPRVKKALLSYIQAEASKDDFEDKEAYGATLKSLAEAIPLKGRVVCTRQGVNFLAKHCAPITTNLGRR